MLDRQRLGAMILLDGIHGGISDCARDSADVGSSASRDVELAYPTMAIGVYSRVGPCCTELHHTMPWERQRFAWHRPVGVVVIPHLEKSNHTCMCAHVPQLASES